MARIGLALSALEARPLDDLVAAAVAADEAGFDLVVVPEAWGREAFTLLGHLAAKTRRVRLGTGIVNVYSRSPALIAMAAATLDEVSGGRAVLGLGASGAKVVQGFHGASMDRPLLRLREVTEAVRSLLRRERSGYQGELVKIDPGFALRMTAPRGDVPIFHASLTPAAIRQAAQVADGWFPFLYPLDAFARDVAVVRDTLARAGRDPASFTIAPFVPALVTDDVGAARFAVKRHVAFYVGGMGRFYREMFARHGYATAMEEVRREWEAGHRDGSANAVPDELVDQVAACGPAERVRARVETFRAAGADLPLIFLPLGSTLEMTTSTIAAFA